MNTGNLFKSKENEELYILVKNIDGKVGIFKNFINSENITSDISCFEKVGFNTSNEFVSWVKSHKGIIPNFKEKIYNSFKNQDEDIILEAIFAVGFEIDFITEEWIDNNRRRRF